MSVFHLRFVVIQCVLLTGLVALWLTGYLVKPFEGESMWFSIVISAFGFAGIVLIGMKRFDDAAWLADMMVRKAVMGMQLGIIAALAVAAAAILSGGDLTQVVALFFKAISIAFYVSLIAVGSNLWIEWNLRLLGWRGNE